MNYAEQILKEILKEEANINFVKDAIQKRHEVEFNYKADDDIKGSGKRRVQPVVLGHSKSGNLVVRAFQPYGDTKTKTPSWKLFRLDRIENWKPLNNTRFSEPPDSQYNTDGKYNPSGDASMTDILVQANFSGSEEYKSGKGKYSGLKRANDARAAAKREKDPYYDLRKNIKKSFNIKDDPRLRKNLEDWQKSQAAKDFRSGNQTSAYEMSQVDNFGDDEATQTVGPVLKNNIETKTTSYKPKYNKVMMNGPIYKNEPQQTDTDEPEIENNNEENENK